MSALQITYFVDKLLIEKITSLLAELNSNLTDHQSNWIERVRTEGIKSLFLDWECNHMIEHWPAVSKAQVGSLAQWVSLEMLSRWIEWLFWHNDKCKYWASLKAVVPFG